MAAIDGCVPHLRRLGLDDAESAPSAAALG